MSTASLRAKRFFWILLSGVPLIFFSSCSQESDSYSKPKSLAGLRPAFLVFGGYATCSVSSTPGKMPMHAPFVDFLDKLGKDPSEVSMMLSCFGVDPDTVHILDSLERDTTVEVKLDALGDEVRRWMSGLEEDEDLVLIGSSYGAWTIVNLLQEGIVPPERVTDIYTIDPISQPECTPKIMTQNILHFNGGYPTVDANPCRRAPKNWRLLDYKSKFWLNFFQTDFPLLHSSETPATSRNEKIDYSTPVLKNLGHKRIQEDKRVWARIYESLAPRL